MVATKIIVSAETADGPEIDMPVFIAERCHVYCNPFLQRPWSSAEIRLLLLLWEMKLRRYRRPTLRSIRHDN